MIVNLDLRGASHPTSGISNFKCNIISHLNDKYNDILFRGCININRHEKKSDFGWFKGFINESFVPDKLIYNNYYKIPINYELMFGNDINVNLFLGYMVPYINFKKPLISTIHDLILLKTNVESENFVANHKKRLEYAVDKSSHIITVSESSKNDICHYFKVNPGDISIVHNGINLDNTALEVCSQGVKANLCKKYNLPEEDFILYFGGYRKHKNIEGLLKAYSVLSDAEKKNLKVVITNRNQELMKMACELHVDKNVFFTGFIDECDKFLLYKTAKMVYYASLYEGWGVPILEAQICKTPVITSNLSSMPEASGGNAMLVNPYSIDDIVDAIRLLNGSSSLLNDIVNRGYLNAMQYTWDRSADELYHTLKMFN